MRSVLHTPARRVAAFGAGLVAVFALAALAGAAVNPKRHADAPPSMHGGHGAMTAGPAGLSIAQDGYRLALEPAARRAGRTQTLRFRVLGADGHPVREFEQEHGARLHLIVVRRDLSGYQHLHPRLGAGGVWSIALDLPEPGSYRAFADFHSGGRALTLGADLLVPGDFQPRALPAAATVTSVDGYAVKLTENKPGMLHFTVRRGGREITDLQPYLGARGHLVALREGDLAYLHVHPDEGPTPGAGISFHAEFPSPGRYRLYLQFRHGGHVHTAEYTREVAR
jgi:hypothetical protein